MNSFTETFSNQWFSATFAWTDGLLTGIDLSAAISPSTQPKSPFGAELGRIVAEYDRLHADQWPDLPLARSGLTRFTWNVLENLRLHAPRGKITTYGELATLSGSPRAARAVGSVMARNPWPLLYPCHRVLTGNMGIGGFGPGIALKRTLLTLEKALLPT
jgi:methylated-DNA-[protein]-cysteine S-methyltransferase